MQSILLFNAFQVSQQWQHGRLRDKTCLLDHLPRRSPLCRQPSCARGLHLDVLQEVAVESGTVHHHVATLPLDEVAGGTVAGLRVIAAVVQPLYARDGVGEAVGSCPDLSIPAGLQMDGVPAADLKIWDPFNEPAMKAIRVSEGKTQPKGDEQNNARRCIFEGGKWLGPESWG